MKKYYFFLFMVVIVCSLALASGKKEAQSISTKTDPAVTIRRVTQMTMEELKEQAKKEGKVVCYTWSNEDYWKDLGAEFEKDYGVKVEVILAEQKPAITKALAEKNGETGSYDVMRVGGDSVSIGLGAGLYYGPIIDSISVKDKLDPALSFRQEGVLTNGYLVPFMLNQSCFAYNPKTVKNPPQTWKELEEWIEKNPMKFGFCPPDKGGSGQAFVLAAIKQLTGGLDQYYPDTELDEEKVKKWGNVWDWMNAYKKKITLTTSNKDSLSRLNQGELNIVAAWADNVYLAVKAGELFKDVGVYIPEFGMPGGGDSVGLIKNAPHPAAGFLFINYLVSDKAQKMGINRLTGTPARIDVEAAHKYVTEKDLKNKLSWIPAFYKGRFKEDFTKYVLMVR